MNIFYNTIVFVKDLQKSKAFYRDVLGLRIAQEFDTIIFFENRFVIHCVRSILKTVYKKGLMRRFFSQGAKNILIYLETDNLEEAYQNILNAKCKIVHPIQKQAWGQSVFRFFDPDGHMLEIGEAMHLTPEDFDMERKVEIEKPIEEKLKS